MPLETAPSISGIRCSNQCTEHLAAFRWKIPLDRWYEMPRTARAAHIATVVADSAINAYYRKED